MKRTAFSSLVGLCLLAGLGCSGFQGAGPTDGGGLSLASTPPPPTIDEKSGYPRYAGCEGPDSSFLTTVYVDPVNGSDSGLGTEASPFKSIANLLAAKKLQPGTHIVALPGPHGALLATKYSNPELQDTKLWIWLDAQPGAVFSSIDLRDMSRWLITGAKLRAEQKTLISLSGGSQFIVSKADLATSDDVTAWTAAEWMNTASSAVATRNTKCVTVVGAKAKNVRFGYSFSSDFKDPADNAMNIVAADNEVDGYSADGFRPNTSNIIMRNNRILNSYVSAADGDGNHDDAVQLFALNGSILENIVIEGSFIQETTNPSRPLLSGIQGISLFDGWSRHVTIRRNIVLASAYHGIAWYGGEDVLIERNTVVSTTTTHNKLWIGSFESKVGGVPRQVVIRDNVASYMSVPAWVDASNNFALKTPATELMKYDLSTMQFDLHASPASIFAGKNAGALD